jgi:hypothetical protein
MSMLYVANAALQGPLDKGCGDLTLIAGSRATQDHVQAISVQRHGFTNNGYYPDVVEHISGNFFKYAICLPQSTLRKTWARFRIVLSTWLNPRHEHAWR